MLPFAGAKGAFARSGVKLRTMDGAKYVVLIQRDDSFAVHIQMGIRMGAAV